MKMHSGSAAAQMPGFAHDEQAGTELRFNVFPHGRMCSMRRVLLMWLVPLFLLVGAASAAFSYWSYTHMVAEFLDNQMEQLGKSIAMQQGQLLPPPTNADRIHKWGDYVVQVYSADGTLQRSSWQQLGAQPQMGSKGGSHDVRIGDSNWRLYCTEQISGGDQRVHVYQSGQFRAQLAAERAGAAMTPVMILLPLAILVLWGVSGAMSRAVRSIGQQAAQQDEHTIAELSLDRVPHELKPMVVSFNSLLTRLRDAFATQRRFVQDAAHELRTPITAVALQLENVRCDLPPGACQQSFAQLAAGVSRAQRLVDQLLKLSRQEARVADSPTVVDVHAQLHESINALITLADQRGIDLGLVVSPAASALLTLRCVDADLRSVLDNLIENALRYTPEGGLVDVQLSGESGRPVIEVMDTGPGIPPEQLGRVFDRFFRVPGSAVRGSGLGLSIAQAAAQRCGLRVTLRNREDRSGLIARVEVIPRSLPAKKPLITA